MTPRRSSRVARGPLLWPAALGLFAASALVVAACSSSSDSHPAGLDVGGANAGAGRSGATSGGAAGESGSPGETNSDSGAPSSLGGESAGGAAPVLEADAGPGRPAPGPAVCSETAAWSGATTIPSVSTAANESLLSITPDELDVAFFRPGALYVAHRADRASTFAVAAAIAPPTGWSATQGAALSADGKRLVLLSTDQTMLGELTRATRGAAFSAAVDQSAFVTVNQTSTFSGNVYASPALSPDDQQLFLNSVSPGGGSTVVVSTRTMGQPWSSPQRVSSELDGASGARRLPTGVSADARTLFYFNEETMKEEARWRQEPKLTSPLYDMVDLGTRRGAQPNSACDRLYSDSANDVVFEQD